MNKLLFSKMVIAAIVMFAGFITFTAQAGVDMFLKIDDIEGESKDETHSEEIDVLAWSWGMSQSTNATTGGGGGQAGGGPNVQDIMIVKWVDKSSPELMLALLTGKHLNEARLVVRKAGKKRRDKPLEYVIITMNDVFITNVSHGGSSNEDRLTENVTLNFAKVEYEYRSQNQDGSAAEPTRFHYNIRENRIE